MYTSIWAKLTRMRGRDTFFSKTFYGSACAFMGAAITALAPRDSIGSPALYAYLAIICWLGSWFTKQH